MSYIDIQFREHLKRKRYVKIHTTSNFTLETKKEEEVVGLPKDWKL